MSECDESAPAVHAWKKRKTTWVDKATGLGAIVAIAATVTGAMAYVLDALPFVKNTEFQQRTTGIEARMTTVEHGLTGINIGQKETQELQLVDRIQSLDDRLTKLKADTADYMDFRQQRNEAQQRLDRIRQELTAARSR